MRITNSTMNRSYLKGLNRNAAMLQKYSTQAMTGQRYTRMSEDPSSAIRAMRARRDLQNNESYIDNAKYTKSLYDAAESTLAQMSNITKSISERLVQANNGDKGADELEAIYTEIEQLQREMLSLANGRFSSRHLFGGTNTTTPPFTAEDGKLLYNGEDVSGMTTADFEDMSFSYMDIGLGMQIDGQNANPNTVFPISFNGAKIMGVGDNNLYNMVSEALEMLSTGSLDHNLMGDLMDRFTAATTNITLQMTEIGAGTQYLEFTIDRLQAEQINLSERQEQLEGKETSAAIMDWKLQEFVYNASLQMGQRLLTPSLFNFLN